MANHALALTLWDNQDGPSRSDCQVVKFDMVGPGRLLHQGYSIAGRCVEEGLGLAAHKLGMGPGPTSLRIEKAFGGDSRTRQSRLDSMHDSLRNETNIQKDRFICALNKDCQKLLEYALPSETPATQLETCKHIITLTTRHPGLRRLFLQCPDIGRVADSPDAIRQLWQNKEYYYDTESRFVLEFAANCLARIEPNIKLEGIRPSELGCACEKGLGVVDELVGYCDDGSGFPRLIAIRYIAATLELPAFWSQNYEVQKLTMDRLCKQTLSLIQDVNPKSVKADDPTLALLDPDGIDALADALLVGGKRWLQLQPRITGLGVDYWLNSFVRVVQMLRNLIKPELLPRASRRAAEDWEALFKDIAYELPRTSLDLFEDFYAFVKVRSRVSPDPLSHMRHEDVAEESPDKKGPSMAGQQNATSAPIENPAPHPSNVIIFGESGSGKSSLVNMIIGQDVAKVSNSPLGSTFENECYKTRIDGIPYHIYDTVGLNEGEEGRIPHWKAIQGLYTLIRKLDGLSLVIFCIRGRVRDNAHANWLFFFDAICDRKVPVIVVSTCWEQEDDLEGAERQVLDPLKKYSMVPKAVACVVSRWGRNNEHEEKYKLSQRKLRRLIVEWRMQEPWNKDKEEWFALLYQRTFDLKFFLFAKSRLQFAEKIRGPFEEFKKNGNLKQGDIDTLTKVLLQAERKLMKKRS